MSEDEADLAIRNNIERNKALVYVTPGGRTMTDVEAIQLKEENRLLRAENERLKYRYEPSQRK